MSAYTTPQALYGKIPQVKVNDALDDNGDANPQAIAANLAQVISNASTEVDSALESRYSVPFFTPFPALVSQCALVFACEDIYSRREIGPEKNPFTKQAVELRQKLKDIAERKLPLDTTTEPESPGAQLGGSAYVPGRLDATVS